MANLMIGEIFIRLTICQTKIKGVNFTSISVTNDNNYLYIRFQTENEIDLLDMEFNGEIV